MKKYWFWLIVVILCFWFCLFSIEKINFLTADIGRHIKNGEIFLHSAEFGMSKWDVLHTNLFSYTYPEFSFVNHHWGSGIIAYLIFSIFGFSGLSVTYIVLLLLALIFALLTVRHDTEVSDIFLAGLFLAPLIADRLEVRPEAISYFFIAFFIYLLWNYSQNRMSHKTLFLIPLAELFWVNLHIYFIFGIFIIGIFFFESLIRKNYIHIKKLFTILVLTCLAAFINPYGFTGVIYPFIIFRNYGYTIVENQSIAFLEKLNFIDPSFLWYKIALVLILISLVLFFLKNRKKIPISLTIISLTFAVLAYLGIRSISVFALVSLPLLAYSIHSIRNSFKISKDTILFFQGIISFGIIVFALFNFSGRLPWNRNFGLGVLPGAFDSSDFIKQNNIQGPIFNNYDIGSSIDFTLFPQEKAFVDNRPEAYPAEFFSDVYIPMQENPDAFAQVDSRYHFNAIYFYRLDMTPWGQQFLVAMVKNPDWAPVYVDAETIIFLKRNSQNQNIISKYELPKNMFSVS